MTKNDVLQNETCIDSMVQGRSRKISYKSKKCVKQDQRDWIVVAGTHEPIVDRETFDKVRALIESRKRTRSRTYDFLLKGLIFCHECGYPLAVINRKTANGEDRLFLFAALTSASRKRASVPAIPSSSRLSPRRWWKRCRRSAGSISRLTG